MNGAYSATEVYTESDIQYIVQYAGAVRLFFYHPLSRAYSHLAEGYRCSPGRYLSLVVVN